MNPADLRKYILEAFALNKPLLAIVREVADLQGVGLNPAGQLVVDELGNAGLGGTIDSASLFAAIGEDADMRQAQEIRPETLDASFASNVARRASEAANQATAEGPLGDAQYNIAAVGNTYEGLREKFLKDLGGTQEGRGELFSSFLTDPSQGAVPGPFQRFRANQFRPTSAEFLLGRGLGNIGLSTTFQDFIQDRSPVPSADFRSNLNEASSILGMPLENLSNTGQGFQAYLAGSPNEQYNLALHSVLGDVPVEFRNAFEGAASDAFGRFQTRTPDLNFLPEFVNRGFRFFG
mgnify:CR=1 FL=1